MSTRRNRMTAGDFDKIISIQRRSVMTNADYGTDEITWVTIADRIHAQIEDIIPNRQSSDETDMNGLVMASRPARVRVRFRTDLSSDMRVIVHSPYRLCVISSQPCELGRRDAIEFVMHDYSSLGDGA